MRLFTEAYLATALALFLLLSGIALVRGGYSELHARIKLLNPDTPVKTVVQLEWAMLGICLLWPVSVVIGFYSLKDRKKT